MNKLNLFYILLKSELFKYDTEKANELCLADAWKVMQIDIMEGAERSRPGANNGLLSFLVDTMDVVSPGFAVGNIQLGLDMGDGKKHVVIRTFTPRLGAQTENGIFDFCGEGGEEIRYKVDAVTIDKETISKKMMIDQEYIRCIKEGSEKVKADTIAQFLRLHLDAFGRQVAAEFKSKHVGKFAKSEGLACKDIPLLLSGGLVPSPMANIQIDEDMMQAEIGIVPTLIGGTRLNAYRNLMKIASANLGTDVSLFGQEFVIYRDTNFETAHPNGFYAIVPGAIKLVTAAYNKGEFADTDEMYFRDTVIDPWYGIEHDIFIHVKKCKKQGTETTIQFITNWALVGYPDCWSEDADFNGVNDVYCYTAICSDAGACGMENGISPAANIPNELEDCNAYETCEVNCRALFVSDCSEKALFIQTGLTGDVYAVDISGLVINLPATYNAATTLGSAALVLAIRNALSAFGVVLQVSGFFAAGATTLHVVTDTSVATFGVIRNAGQTVVFTRTVQYLQHVVDQSTPSGNATSYTLNWVPPFGLPFSGLPMDSINEAGHFGVMGNFYALTIEGGIYALTILDNTACTNEYSASLLPCEGLLFDLVLNTFADTNDNDIKDVGESFLANIKLKLWKGIVQVELVDEIVTAAVTGIATFNLESGVYNVTVDETFGAAIGRDITTTLPKFINISVNGTITYSGFTANGLVPIGPVI